MDPNGPKTRKHTGPGAVTLAQPAPTPSTGLCTPAQPVEASTGSLTPVQLVPSESSTGSVSPTQPGLTPTQLALPEPSAPGTSAALSCDVAAMLKVFHAKPRRPRIQHWYSHRHWASRIAPTYEELVAASPDTSDAPIKVVTLAIDRCWAAESEEFKAALQEEMNKLFTDQLHDWDTLVNATDGIEIDPGERTRLAPSFPPSVYSTNDFHRRMGLLLPTLQLFADGAEQALGVCVTIMVSGLVRRDDGSGAGKDVFSTSR